MKHFRISVSSTFFGCRLCSAMILFRFRRISPSFVVKIPCIFAIHCVRLQPANPVDDYAYVSYMAIVLVT